MVLKNLSARGFPARVMRSGCSGAKWSPIVVAGPAHVNHKAPLRGQNILLTTVLFYY